MGEEKDEDGARIDQWSCEYESKGCLKAWLRHRQTNSWKRVGTLKIETQVLISGDIN